MPSIEQVTNDRCCGCSGCYNVCPEYAITMVLSAEGFYRPVLDRNRCTDCGRCVTRCPELSWRAPLQHPPAVFAAWSSDDTVRMESSSGGVFSELARATLDKGGATVACAWSALWDAEHVVVDSWADVERLRGSKYIPSRMGITIQQVVKLARQGREALFCGTPCQVAAVSLALPKKLRSRIVLVDLICWGVPSLRAFQQYRDEMFPEGLEQYRFRTKTNGWNCSSTEAVTKTQRAYSIRTQDVFRQAYHLISMRSCHNCRFQGGPRPGDITMGDFWGVPEKWNDRRGVSVVMANSDAGDARIAELVENGRLLVEASDFATAASSNPRLLSGLRPVPHLRKVFLAGIAQGVFMKLARVFLPPLRMSLVFRLVNTRGGRKLLLSKARRQAPFQKVIGGIRCLR